MAKHFLYLTNDKLVALIWKNGAIVERDVFAATELGQPAFSAYIARHRDVATYVVTDLIEEDFRLDTVPHLRGSDQEAVLGRKLAQLYRASPFRHGIIQGREAEGRRDDKVLYHAVTNPEILKPLLSAIERAEVPLEGIYSSAVLSGQLLESLNSFFTHTLLVTIIPDFGLRQTYFQNKKIKFSRLTPIIFDEGQPAGELIAAETSRTWQYLDSLRFFASGETLEVSILIHAHDRQMVTEAIRSYPLIQYRFLDIDEVAAKLKLKPAPVSSHAEEVLVHLYAQNRIENHFATPEQRRFGMYKRVRFGLFALTAAVLAVGTMAAMFNLYEASKISTDIDRRTQAMKPLQTEYRTVVSEISKQTAASETVRDASAFFNQYMRPIPAAPGDFVRAFAQALTEYPNIQLLQLVWAPAGDPNQTPLYTVSPAQGTNLLQSKAGTTPGGQAGVNAVPPAAPQLASGTATDPTLPESKFQALVVEAAISPFNGDYRKAIKDINVFIARINQLPDVKATLIVEPLDVRTSASITSAETPQATVLPDARFVVKLVRSMKVAH
ncbi:MAG: hypothetical protein LH481_01345 [Burkholderiales bacterium]|nr:hypothetical protein [Burkholderiales bacterium]